MSNAQHSSASAEHYTPSPIVEAARATMGGIDLDPASCLRANARIVKATNFFTERDNGFMRPWKGRVFLNPPGGLCDEQGLTVRLTKGEGYFYADGSRFEGRRPQSAICAWWNKLAFEWRRNRVTDAVFIGFSLELIARTQGGPVSLAGKKVHHSLVSEASALCFPQKRIKFFTPIGVSDIEEGKAPTHANVIAYLGDEPEQFAEHFSKFGEVGQFVRLGQ